MAANNHLVVRKAICPSLHGLIGNAQMVEYIDIEVFFHTTRNVACGSFFPVLALYDFRPVSGVEPTKVARNLTFAL